MLPRSHSRIARSAISIAVALSTFFIVCSITPMVQAQKTKTRVVQKSQRASSRDGGAERVDRRAGTLNRATALAILKETAPRIRPKLNIAWSLPLSGPQLTTPYRDSDFPGTIAEVERQRKLLASNLELYLLLVKAGFLTGPTSSLLEIPDPTGHRQTTFVFELIPQPGIEVTQLNNWERDALFTLVQGSVTQVTGIYQEPGAATATVMATIAIEPTQLYWRLKKVVEAISANQTLASDSGYPALWANFPDVAELYQTDTQQRTFIRFDDGWRCCR
jgi:hypothetical protein